MPYGLHFFRLKNCYLNGTLSLQNSLRIRYCKLQRGQHVLPKKQTACATIMTFAQYL